MSSQTKFLISMLFIVVIILCVVLTRFYFDVSKNTGSSSRDSRIEAITHTFGEIQAFRSENGGVGLLNADLSVLIEPDWLDVVDVTDKLILVTDRLDNRILTGGIDYEENIILPFVFRSMEKSENNIHIGIVEADGRCIIYDENYQPIFQESFASAEYQEHLLVLKNQNETFSYDMTGQMPVLRNVEFDCQIAENVILHWKTSNQYYFSELEADDLRRINAIAQKYMQMLHDDNFSNLSEISTGEYFASLTKPNLLHGMTYTQVNDFSFSRRESGAYDFSFLAEGQKNMRIHFYFRKNSENQVILTAADVNPNAEE
ncbi:MAG: hypothetical protein IKI37_01825 [Oscillospiraceae bacterium]|nr:hypothetical protein [Oscillospiraceae bacterium]MBR7083905.1 hypothetical protein [Oscillospiraceae bacterium]